MIGFTNAVLGQFMLSPISVTESGLGTFSPQLTGLTNMINQSGLDVPFISGSTDFDAYFAPPNANFTRNADGTKWQSDLTFNLPLEGTLDFDLGGSYQVSKVGIWNISVKSLSVLVSQDPNGPWIDAGRFALLDAQTSLSLRATVLDLGAGHRGRHVRLAIESEYPAVPNVTYGYATLGEVVVRATPDAAPTLEIGRESNGDITVRFTGVLQSAPDLNAPFIDVPGNPSGTLVIPAGSVAAGQFYRAKN